MKHLFGTISRLTFSLFGNALLMTVAGGVAACGIGLTALYLIEHIEETPALKSLQCFVGIPPRPDCPRYHEEMERLRIERDAVIADRDAVMVEYDDVQRQLAGLRAIENAVDEITLFEYHVEPDSGSTIVVGTVYREFVNEQPEPASHFCYLMLEDGDAGEDTNLWFRTSSGVVDVTPTTLRKTGITAESLEYGRSVCTPYLIGQS